jgi:hypothetical protein
MRAILILLFLFISCETPPRKVTSSYHGVESNAYQTNCSQQLLEVYCKEELDETKNFKSRCIGQKKKIVKCDCDEYLCIDQKTKSDVSFTTPSDIEDQNEFELGKILKDSTIEYTGVNFYGEVRTCTSLSAKTFCTFEFTKEDNYGYECRKKGYDIVFCGCHDPICLRVPK